jgi:hypothetical protein
MTEVWDLKDGFTGVRYEFHKLVSSTRKEQLSNASLYLTGDGLVVAKKMIQASASFLETMETWISQQYNDLFGQGGSKKECWAYVCLTFGESIHQSLNLVIIWRCIYTR